jgi:hypothetical protein
MKALFVVTVLILSASVLLAAPYLTVLFEFTVGPDGSRQNLHIVRVEVPATHQEVKNALTEKERQVGISLIAQRKPLSPKDAGRKLYNIELFDTATRRYSGH